MTSSSVSSTGCSAPPKCSVKRPATRPPYSCPGSGTGRRCAGVPGPEPGGGRHRRFAARVPDTIVADASVRHGWEERGSALPARATRRRPTVGARRARRGSAWLPRSAKSIPDPATRSATVDETSTSPGSPRPPPGRRHGRRSRRCPRRAPPPRRRAALPAARLPGGAPARGRPARSGWRPPAPGTSTACRRRCPSRTDPGGDRAPGVRRRAGRRAASASGGRRARLASAVDPTTSVNTTVARTRSASAVARPPVRNSSTSSRSASASPANGSRSSPGTST